ncbi:MULTISPECIES: hypothetical protein [Clostridium]|uniref:Ribose 5-phosphate isomerase n=1 Tax=Clostridium aquiflavi TaxID=3073603 RepID=A0ABU1EH62_9CLOT|nr:hypothetical protein [Clostridium sp. 5N-1]MDR5587734.1 hypothetical protein [Clostridium sp. 5N-1]NFG62434.1 hypothetical protein [Clostridium botulinum]NFQ09048.1 hypothetical protein [Clostridium botulinum]
MISKMKYINILNGLCEYYGIGEQDLIELLKERENKYLLLLLLKNYSCLEQENAKEILRVKSSQSVNNNLKSAEEKLLINRDFRKKYFEIQDNIDRIEKI